MSMELHVLFHGRLPSRIAVNRTMTELGFALSIAAEVGSLERQAGYMPMRLWREKAGVEFQVFEGRAIVDDLTKRTGPVDARFDRCASFRWGGSEREMLCALSAAAALAKLVDGLVLDEAAGKLLSVGDAIDVALKHLRDGPPSP